LLGPVGLVGAVVRCWGSRLGRAVTGALAVEQLRGCHGLLEPERMAFDGAGVAGVGLPLQGLAGATGRRPWLGHWA